MAAFITPFAYEAEYLELHKLSTRQAHKEYVRRTIGAIDAATDKVVRVYLALRSMMPGSMREDCESDEEELECEKTLVESCCTVSGVEPHVAEMVRVGRMHALCHVAVVAHLVLFHECPASFIKWMCQEARVRPSFPMFEFKLHALALVESVRDVERARGPMSTLCTDRDMSALQLFCHDLLAMLQRQRLLHIDDEGEGSRIQAVVEAVYGRELAFEALGYCSLLRTPFYDKTGTNHRACRVARHFTERDWYRVLINYGQCVAAPGAPDRKRARN